MEILSNFDSQSTEPPPFSHSAGEIPISPVGRREESDQYSLAAVKLQKAYRGYRTRRSLADAAVFVERLWWQAMDYVSLNGSTSSSSDYSKPETAASRWNRVGSNASKDLSIDVQAKTLALWHWLEAIDPRHRYGRNLYFYYKKWLKTDGCDQPFFYWLDVGEGKDRSVKECPRLILQLQQIKYLGPKEREDYEYVILDGKIVHKLTGNLLNTMDGTKWIFVMSPVKKLYAGPGQKKGRIHYSSFLAGGAMLAAGRLVAESGVLKMIFPYSGPKLTKDDTLGRFLPFLRENGVNLDEVELL